jgi:hypothetical protein
LPENGGLATDAWRFNQIGALYLNKAGLSGKFPKLSSSAIRVTRKVDC